MPIDPIADQNCVRRFLLDEADDARVATVRLTQALSAMLDHQAMPTPVFSLCGELAAAACLLADMLKFKGEMIIQLKGDGPVSLLVADSIALLVFFKVLLDLFAERSGLL